MACRCVTAGFPGWCRAAELDMHGADPDAAFFIEPAQGYYVSDGVAGGAALVGDDPPAGATVSSRPSHGCTRV